MSYYTNPNDLAKWLESAAFAPITKNKVRKELLEQLASISYLSFNVSNEFKIQNSHRLAMVTFLQKDGKAGYGETMFTDDQLLNWSTTLDTVTKQLEQFLSSRHTYTDKYPKSMLMTSTVKKNDIDEKSESLSFPVSTSSNQVSPEKNLSNTLYNAEQE